MDEKLQKNNQMIAERSENNNPQLNGTNINNTVDQTKIPDTKYENNFKNQIELNIVKKKLENEEKILKEKRIKEARERVAQQKRKWQEAVQKVPYSQRKRRRNVECSEEVISTSPTYNKIKLQNKIEITTTEKLNDDDEETEEEETESDEDTIEEDSPKRLKRSLDQMSDSNETYKVEEIVGKRQKKNMQIQYKIKWKGYSDEYNTWEDSELIEHEAGSLVSQYDKKKNNEDLKSKILEKLIKEDVEKVNPLPTPKQEKKCEKRHIPQFPIIGNINTTEIIFQSSTIINQSPPIIPKISRKVNNHLMPKAQLKQPQRTLLPKEKLDILDNNGFHTGNDSAPRRKMRQRRTKQSPVPKITPIIAPRIAPKEIN